MRNLKDLWRQILSEGSHTNDRTGVGTVSYWGTTLRFNLQEGFPATTCKELKFLGVVGELLWFLEGSSNVERLRELTYGKGSTKRTIWDDNYENQGKALGYTDGELGPVYGVQWRDFGGVDQIEAVLQGLKRDLETKVLGRRHIVSAWNPAEVPDMTLPPCHVLSQYKLRQTDGKWYLDSCWYQRSVDAFLGLPYNIASYALLTHIFASILKVEVGELVFMGADTHLYMNHIDQVNKALDNKRFNLPSLKMPRVESLDDLKNYTAKDFTLENYLHSGFIKAPMAV
jgi:thymidylate synthase